MESVKKIKSPRGRPRLYTPEEAKLRLRECQKRFAEKNKDKYRECKLQYMRDYQKIIKIKLKLYQKNHMKKIELKY